MVSLSSARDASAASRMTSAAETSSTLNGSPSVSLFCVSVPVLSEHSTSTPANSSIADQLAHDRLFLGEQTRADRHRHRQHRRHRHGNRGDGQHQRELQRREDRVAAKDRDGDDHRHQDDREDDQVIADLQHRALKVADSMRRLHQLARSCRNTCLCPWHRPARRSRPGGRSSRRTPPRRSCAWRAAIRPSAPTDRPRSDRRRAAAHRPGRYRPGAGE